MIGNYFGSYLPVEACNILAVSPKSEAVGFQFGCCAVGTNQQIVEQDILVAALEALPPQVPQSEKPWRLATRG